MLHGYHDEPPHPQLLHMYDCLNVVSWEQIKTATAEDSEMQDLMKYIMSTWSCWGIAWSCPRPSAPPSSTSCMLHTRV